MTESKKSSNNKPTLGSSGNAPLTRVTIGIASNNAPIKESLNAPVRQFNGSQDAPSTNTRGKQVSSKLTAKTDTAD